MMGRILRIELRRSAAVGVGLLLAVLGTGAMLSFTQGFAGRWMQLAANARISLVLLWPLALAGGGWLGRRDGQHRVGELFASTVRPRWQRILPTAGALAVTVVTGYALMVLVSAGWVVPTAGYFPVTAVVVTAVGALSLVAAAWLGMAAGRAVPRLVTAPALAVAGAVVAGLLPTWRSTPPGLINHRPDPAALLLTPVYTSSLDDFQTILGRVSLAQALWLAALAATGLLLLGAVRRPAIALALLPAVLGAAVAVPLMPTGGYNAAAAVDPAAVRLVCDQHDPQVCVTRAHAGLLPGVVAPARQALAMLAAKLPNAPTRAVESQLPAEWTGQRPDAKTVEHRADTLVFDPPSIGPTGRADFTDDPFVQRLVAAAWQQECGNDRDPSDVYLAYAVAVAWVTGQPLAPESWWPPEQRALADQVHKALTGLSPQEQQRRMMAARDAALACRTVAVLSTMAGDAQ